MNESAPRVTVVTVPRERFSCTPRTLEALYAATTIPFAHVYVDGGSPRPIQRYLAAQAQALGFELVRTERLLAPNEARNLGLKSVQTELVVFLDNDVVVSPGWLEALLACADDTGGTVVGPLTCIGDPIEETIHFAGGEVHILEEADDGAPSRHVKEKMYHPNRKVSSVRGELRRQRCELAEFHCVMARTKLFERIGPFDEEMLNTREHLDFCLDVARDGGTVWFEPDSVVTYVPGPPFARYDLRFYMLRWSDEWERRSLQRFRQKWQLADDDFFRRRLSRLGWRRHTSLLDPLSSKLTLGRPGSHKVRRMLQPPERLLNRYLTSSHARARARSGL